MKAQTYKNILKVDTYRLSEETGAVNNLPAEDVIKGVVCFFMVLDF